MSDVKYYPIDDEAARRAHEMNSFRTYVDGQTTKEYQSQVDEACKIALRQKEQVEVMYHEKIDGLLAAYSRKLAGWYNKGSAIEQMCPSIMVSGGGNFPVWRKEKQNAARNRHMKELENIKRLLNKIESIGTGGISSDDPNAIDKLKERLDYLENGGGKGRMASNVSAEKRRLKNRIAELERRVEKPPEGWKFDGGEVVANADKNRLQVFFDGKPDEVMRHELKSRGFRWAPSVGAWQRQLTNNAVYAAKEVLTAAGNNG